MFKTSPKRWAVSPLTVLGWDARRRPVAASALLSLAMGTLPPAGAVLPHEVVAQEFQFDADFPMELIDVSIIGLEEEFGVLLDSDLGWDGVVYLLDYSNSQVIAVDPSGEVAWRRGGEGQGPGEFRTPYRLTEARDGVLHVFDLYGRAISRFSPDGEFIDRRQVQATFEAVTDLVVHPDGRTAISGTSSYGVAMGWAVHVFTPDLRHVHSFGPLPTAENPMALSYHGAGPLTATPEGDLLYVRRLPYDIHRYSLDGDHLATFDTPFEYDVTADDRLNFEEREGGGITTSRSDVEMPRFGEAVMLADSLFVVSRREGDRRFLDLFTYDSGYVGTASIPADWGSLVGFDRNRGFLWTTGEHLLQPVLRRLHITLKP